MTFLYFAYGMNMSHEHMKLACSQSSYIGRAFLEGYKMVYDGCSDYMRRRAQANIVDCDGGVVWGGLYEVEESGLDALDASESSPRSFDRGKAVVKNDEGKTYDAVIYCREGRAPGGPSTEYRQILIQGAKDCKLPKKYQTQVTYRISH